MRTTEAQSDFTGGMNDRLAPERLQPNQFASAKNMETRYGGIRSRRGSWRINGGLIDSAGTDVEVTGSLVYRSPSVGQSDTILSAAYFDDDDVTRIYQIAFPIGDYAAPIGTPVDLTGKRNVRFVQAYGYAYAFIDGLEPLRWSGVGDETFGYVPNGTSGAMPLARDGVYAYNRLWLIEGDDTIIASDLLSANWDRINNEFRVEQGDGERLVALRPFSNGNLIAFKERGIAVISGANNFVSTSDMTMQFIDDKIGCIAPDTAVAIGKDVFFLGREGVWTIRQTSEQNAQLVELPLSEPIWGLIQDISWQYADRFSATHFDNYYILAVSVEGSEYPNRLLVFDLLSKSWVGYWEYGSTLKTFQRVDTADHLSKQFLLALEDNSATSALLLGDTEDLVGGAENYLTNNRIINSTINVSEHTSGTIEVRLRNTDNSTGLDPLRQKGGGNGDVGLSFSKNASDVWQVTFDISTSTSGAFKAEFPEFPVNMDRSWHTISITGTGSSLFCTVDGYATKEMVPNTGLETYDGTWLSSENNIIIDSSSNADIAHVRLHTEETVVSDPWLYYWPMEAINDLNVYALRYDINAAGTVTETQEAAYDFAETAIQNDGYASSAGSGEGITSEVKTRGYTHGGELAQKSAYRGELRFEHGQPSVTGVMGSDKPFDTETLASLNAKTYSLTKYDIHGKADWVQDNSNDDFGTPFREDYAPIELDGAGSGVEIGASGLDLDVYAEHTELFSSLAIAGWVQFTLTNTQGYVRYNNLQIEADNRALQQDGGNQ